MKKYLLLPVMFIALLFSSCQEADDDVDMPIPVTEKTLDEKILGSWDEIGYNDVYIFYGESFALLHNDDGNDQGGGDYFTTQKKDKAYISIIGSMGNEYYSYEITSITDSSMTWETTPANYGHIDHIKREFRKRKVVGEWKKVSTTKVIYDTAGEVLKKEGTNYKDLYYSFGYNIFDVYSYSENEYMDYGCYYSIHYTADGKTYLSIDGNDTHKAVKVEVLFPTDSQMRWIQKESATVSYITEFAKEKR